MSDIDDRIASLRQEADQLEAMKAEAPPRGTLLIDSQGFRVSSGKLTADGKLLCLLPDAQGVWVDSAETASRWRLAGFGDDLACDLTKGMTVMAKPLDSELS